MEGQDLLGDENYYGSELKSLADIEKLCDAALLVNTYPPKKKLTNWYHNTFTA